MELSDWQIHLEKHFDQLRKERSAISNNHPIYALEHGLGKQELNLLSEVIKKQILHAPPHKAQPLPWIVYATEIGYDYAGDEYWQTFENETPGWTTNGDRYWLRSCFLWFHKQYYGVKPTGRWAEHFSIICWPITHAVLPKDLQRQLARILFELRHSFSAELFESPMTLGERIAARSWNATSRFQNFVEETLLVGQIGAALLLQGKFGTAGILHEGTLNRIGEDLDRERMAREWLRGARKEAERRVSIHGLAFGHGRSSPITYPLEKARSEVQALGIEPRLILKPIDTQKYLFEVLLEIPDFSHLLFIFPNLRDILTGSRCIVAGSSGRPLARGSCLYGSQRKELSKWPSSEEVLLKFDRTEPQLEYLLRTECLLRPGPTWLFRIATDNLAYEMRSLVVRPGGRYIVLNSDSMPNLDGIAKPIELTCDGIYGVIIELPETLTEDWEKWTSNQGLSRAKAIEVWPAGLGAVAWDGEGYGEWLASERPCLGICSDHYIDSLIVSMGAKSSQKLEIVPVTPGEHIFVELPELPVGLHTVKFSMRRDDSEEEESLGDLDVIMRIRAVRPWSPGITPQGPLSFQMDPISPTLEQLWEGRIELALQGPKGCQIECKISLFENNTDPPTLIRRLPSFELPVSISKWRDAFDSYFKNVKEVEIAYDAARASEVDFNAEELGAFCIRFEREFAPLRWTLRREKQGHVARILDDSGKSSSPKIFFYTFDKPSFAEGLEYDSSYRAPEGGGLYVAQQGYLHASIIIPPSGVITSFSALRCTPHFDMFDRSSDAIINLLRLSVLWSTARLPGNPIATIRQRDILLEFIRQEFLILVGGKWYEVERMVADNKYNIMELTKRFSRQSNDMGLAESLVRQYKSFATVTCEQRARQLASIAVKLLHLKSAPPATTVISKGIIRKRPVRSADNPNWLCELALRLASDPSTAETWAGDGLHDGLERLLQMPMLARASRFLVIATDHESSLNVIPGKPYACWVWS